MRERGDTIIEVMFAFVVFSLVTIGLMSIMNQGIAMAQRSLEITLVRQQIDSQADLVRYVRNNKNTGPTDLWPSLKATASTSIDSFKGQTDCPEEAPANTFFIRPTATDIDLQSLSGNTNFAEAATYSRFDYADGTGPTPTAYGIWLQAVRVETDPGRPQAYDIHIRACWDTVGTAVPMTLGTIVRLYDQ